MITGWIVDVVRNDFGVDRPSDSVVTGDLNKKNSLGAILRDACTVPWKYHFTQIGEWNNFVDHTIETSSGSPVDDLICAALTD